MGNEAYYWTADSYSANEGFAIWLNYTWSGIAIYPDLYQTFYPQKTNKYAVRCVKTNDDHDGDGFTQEQGDCNDLDPAIYPGATEICGNSIDEDCINGDLSCNDVDNDGDVYTENEDDCDDTNAEAFPGQPLYFDIPYDGLNWDYNCSSLFELEYPNLANSETQEEGWVGTVPSCGETGNYAIYIGSQQMIGPRTQNCH